MNEIIKGYQYSPTDGKYIGEYEFPNNMDKSDVHLPPFTTLQPPPVGDHNDVAFWRGDGWELTLVPDETYVPPIEDYLLITESFIQYLKDAGRWTEEDQEKREAAITEYEQSKIAHASIDTPLDGPEAMNPEVGASDGA